MHFVANCSIPMTYDSQARLNPYVSTTYEKIVKKIPARGRARTKFLFD
tara:strand:+ start:107 stop:250 length:144 start_codon:yes stop_codon:yes gene_type:complete